MKFLDVLVEKLDNKYLTLSLILLLALILRLYNIHLEGLWTDEMISVYASNPHFSLRRTYDVLHFWDQTPPLYPVLFWFWLKITGFTELNAHLFSVIGGMLSLIAVYFLIKELYNRRTALLVTFITSLIPYHIYFSREARSYIWSFLMSTIVLIFFFKQFKHYHKKSVRWGFIISGGLFLLVSYFSFFVHAALIAVLFFKFLSNRKNFPLFKWIIDYILIGLIFTPWFLQFIKIIVMHNQARDGSPSVTYLFQMFNVFSGAVAGGTVLAIAYIIAAILFIYFTYLQKKQFQQANIFYTAIIIFLIIFILMFIKSIGERNILNGFMYSYVIVSFPVFLIIISGFFKQLNKLILSSFIIVFLFTLVYNHDTWLKLSYHKKKSEPYRELASFISKSEKSDIPILCYSKYIQEFYFFKLHRDNQLVDLSEMNQKINPDSSAYIWVVDNFNSEADSVLNELQKKFEVNIQNKNKIKAPTGDIYFRAFLVEINKKES